MSLPWPVWDQAFIDLLDMYFISQQDHLLASSLLIYNLDQYWPTGSFI